MLNIKFQILIAFFCYVCTVFSETSFIPKGQRAEVFELTDNEVPVFRVTLPDAEFLTLKDTAKDGIDFTDTVGVVNELIKSFVEVISNQNLFEAFPNTDLSEVLPELPITEDGYSNIDCTKLFIDEEYIKDIGTNNYFEIVNDVFINSSYLNMFKIIYVLSELEMSPKASTKFKSDLSEIKMYIIIDENGNYIMSMEKLMENADNTNVGFSVVDEINEYITYIIDLINSQNFLEAFPNANFTEILPELPLTEEGYPNIDYTKYLITEEDFQKFEEEDNYFIILLETINDDSYLNLIKVIYALTELDMSSDINPTFINLLTEVKNGIMIDENGNFEIDKSNINHNNYYYKKFKNINTKELYELINNYNINDPRETIGNRYKKDFKTKNATMIVEMNK